MEKICIVKRRREQAQPEIKVTPAPPNNQKDVLTLKNVKTIFMPMNNLSHPIKNRRRVLR